MTTAATRTRIAGAIALFPMALLHANTLSAQTTVVPQPVPNTLRGIVTDTLGVPLADALVLITELRRQVRTRPDGRFLFDSVKPGTYEVRPRRLGYVAANQRVEVTEQGGSVHIRMIQFRNVLPSVVTQADLGGLSGVIADTDRNPLQGATISVMGEGKSARTDITGNFFIPLKAGQYMVRIEREGHVRQMMGVMIPENEGRRIAAWLVPGKGNASDIMIGVNLFNMNQRLVRSSPTSSKYFTAEALTRQGIDDLLELARRNAIGTVTPDCEVSIGNQPGGPLPLSAIYTDEVEFVEVYSPSMAGGASGRVRGNTSLGGNTRKITTPTFQAPSTSRACGNLGIIVWLRQ